MQRYVHNVYRSHAQSGEGFDTPSAPCVPVNKGQDIHLRTIEDIGHARESARPILNRVLRKTEAGTRWSLNFVLLPNRPRTVHNQTVTNRGNVVKNLFVRNLGPEVTHELRRLFEAYGQSSEWQHAKRSYLGRELRSTQTRTPSSIGERGPRRRGLRGRVGECLWLQGLLGQLWTITFFLHRSEARLVWCRNPGRSQAGA
jgi:hypothetical protein